MHVSRSLVLALGLAAGLAASAQMASAPSAPVVSVPFPTGADTTLGAQITELLADPAAARAHWGVAVTALDGTPIYGLDEGKLFRPASTAKLFTTAAAMALLGPEKTFKTRVFGKLDVATGVVEGDLTLVGGGDADFGANDLPYVTPLLRQEDEPKLPALQDLEVLADQLAARGVKHVAGKIVGDDSLFPWETYAEGWEADDLAWGYGAVPSALSVANNELRLTVTPGRTTGSGSREISYPSTAKLEQNGVPYYTLQTQVESAAPGSRDNNIQIETQVEYIPGPHTLRVSGTLAEGGPPDVEHVAMDDPAEYAAMALRGMLLQHGIAVDGGVSSYHQPAKGGSFLSELHEPARCEDLMLSGGSCGGNCFMRMQPGTVLASHTSAPLAEDVRLTDKVSENLHAEIMLHQMGRLVFCGDGSTVSGARMVRAFLLKGGLDGDDFVFYDGSGLSVKDLVAPRAEAQLLAFAAKQPWFAQWKAALPVGGVDGTLQYRFTEPPLMGHVFAKTGTLGESRALAGYLDCASGRQVIFSIMADDHEPGSSADRAVMDKIVAAIAAVE